MSTTIDDLAVAIAALHKSVDGLGERVQKLEEAERVVKMRVIKEQERREERSPMEDPLDTYARVLHETLRRNRAENDLPYGLGIASLIAQSAKKTSTGTAYSIITFEKPEDLPDDARLLARTNSLAVLAADPLVLRVFRHFFKLRFEGKPPQATAAELATELGSTPERIEELLKPLVDDNTCQRGLSVQGDAFYEWEGNSHRIIAALFQG